MSGAPAWCARWIGLPFADGGRGPEFDCWGLARAVALERQGVELPSHAGEYVSTADREDLARIVTGAQGQFVRVEISEAREGDLIVLRVAGEPCHVAYCLGGGLMLHTLRGCESVVERYDRGLWARRVDGVWRA